MEIDLLHALNEFVWPTTTLLPVPSPVTPVFNRKPEYPVRVLAAQGELP